MRSLTARMLLFNLLLVFFPIGVFLTLDTYEKQLLNSQERAMVQQGRLLASALAAADPKPEGLAEAAAAVLTVLAGRSEARIRVVDSRGQLAADSASLGGSADRFTSTEITPNPVEEGAFVDETSQEGERPSRENFLYRLAVYPLNLLSRLLMPPLPPPSQVEFYSRRGVMDGPEIAAALSGRYGAATRLSEGQRSVTLYSAIPIAMGEDIRGAVLVSQSTFKILSDLYELRLDVIRIFFLALAAAVILSLLLSMTITIPVHRLRIQAESLLDRRGKLRGTIPSKRGTNEIARLARSLHRFSVKLEERQNYLDSFLTDTVHEINNPITGVVTSLELARETLEEKKGEYSSVPYTRMDGFLSVAEEEIRRVRHLVTELREMNFVENRLDEEESCEFELGAYLAALTEVHGPVMEGRRGVCLEVCLPREPAAIRLNPERLTQALLNLLLNAESFSPPGETITLTLTSSGEKAMVTVEDRGPGIPPENGELIFHRFFSERPGSSGREHSGLGLAIVKAIIEGYGGSITVENRKSGGARFRILLPLLS